MTVQISHYNKQRLFKSAITTNRACSNQPLQQIVLAQISHCSKQCLLKSATKSKVYKSHCPPKLKWLHPLPQMDTFLLLLHSLLHLRGSPVWVRFSCIWPLFNPTIEVVTFHLRGWCMLGVLLLPAFTYVGQEIRIFWVHACVHRLDISLYSHLKEIFWNGVRTNVNSKGKIPSTGDWEEDRTCDAAPHRTASPTHYWLSCSVMLHYTGQPAQHTTDWAVPSCCITQDSQPNTLLTELFRHAALHRTASPTHYWLSCSVMLHYTGQPAQHTTDWAVLSCCTTQDSQPNTLLTELFRHAALHRTASTTHYWLSCFVMLHHTGQPAQHTTDWTVLAPDMLLPTVETNRCQWPSFCFRFQCPWASCLNLYKHSSMGGSEKFWFYWRTKKYRAGVH